MNKTNDNFSIKKEKNNPLQIINRDFKNFIDSIDNVAGFISILNNLEDASAKVEAEKVLKNLETALENYKAKLDAFNSLGSDDYSEENNQLAKINDEYRSLGFKACDHLEETINSNWQIDLHEYFDKNLISRIRNCIEETLPFKIYVLSTSDSLPPYETGLSETGKTTNTKSIDWKYIGHAVFHDEAYHYVENDSNCWCRLNGMTWRHICFDPDNENTSNFVKIETAFYTEYFDIYAPGPIGHLFKFRKAEAICCLCNKKIEGYGNGFNHERQALHSADVTFRCCDECYKKVKPSDNKKRVVVKK